jgi:hypothetical protein
MAPARARFPDSPAHQAERQRKQEDRLWPLDHAGGAPLGAQGRG